MKSSIPPLVVLFALGHFSLAQQNCSNPIQATVCPSVTFTGQTNAGMLDDAYSTCGVTGEDVCYQVNTPVTTQRIYVSLTGVSAGLRMVLQNGPCGSGTCTSKNVAAGSSAWTFNVGGFSSYFLWIDATGTVTYSISIGGDTSNTFVNIPNTQGNLDFDYSGCATPMFKSSKPFYQVSYNGVYKTDPMTLAPLNVSGVLCIIAYFKNTTGIEAIKQFDFYYNPSGFSSFSPVSSNLPGFYLPGNWVATSGTNKWSFTFYDTLGIGKGDFALLPNTCLRYEFCFNVTPVTNDPVLTNILDTARSDGFGTGFTGTIRSGCCPPGFANCLGISGGGSSAAQAFGFGVNDPGGGGLPIVLRSFEAHESNGDVEVHWITQTEINNEYFTIQKSQDALEWKTAALVSGAGNSTTEQFYSYTDREAYEGVSYYRLKQTDYDGTSSYSQVVAVNITKTEITYYPNPVQNILWIQTGAETNAAFNFYLVNNMGQKWKPESEQGSRPGEFSLDLSSLEKGIYLLEIEGNADDSFRKIILKN